MVRLGQYILSILSLSSWRDNSVVTPSISTNSADPSLLKISTPTHDGDDSGVGKSIAIVGAGSGGLAILKTILDLPQDVRSNWNIVLYEQRRDVGGLWLPDVNEPKPPVLPETPLYPLLVTNTPHPTMTYPGFTFPPNTPLFPRHDYVEQYHVDFAAHFNLTSYIRLNHTVHAAGWRGNSTHGKWDLEVHHQQDGAAGSHVETIRRSFDHLIVANGHNHYPRVPRWNGTEEWLANSPPDGPKRELLHSIFYRDPNHYANRTVVIVGGGASGRDAVLQVGPVARKTYHSLRPTTPPTPGAPVILKPTISHFTSNSIVFTDGTALTSVDAVILATGYSFLIPFLSRAPSHTDVSPGLIVSPSTDQNSTNATSLISNTKYIFPLYEHIFSLSPTHPPTALTFIGLPVLIANCPSDIAQSLLLAQALADPSVLPSHSEMLDGLVQQENRLRQRGFDPYEVGHKMVGGDDDAQAYQDALVRYLKEKKRLPDDGKDYVEQWRRDARKESFLLKRAWDRVEEEGDSEKWLDGIETEEEWADLMGRLTIWQKKYEEEHGEHLSDVWDNVY